MKDMRSFFFFFFYTFEFAYMYKHKLSDEIGCQLKDRRGRILEPQPMVYNRFT